MILEEQCKSKILQNIINSTWNKVVQPLTATNGSALNYKLMQNVETLRRAQKIKDINEKEKAQKQYELKEKIKSQIQHKFKRPLIITKAPQKDLTLIKYTSSTPVCSMSYDATKNEIEPNFRESRVLHDLHNKLEELKSELLNNTKSFTERQRRTRGERKKCKLSMSLIQDENKISSMPIFEVGKLNHLYNI